MALRDIVVDGKDATGVLRKRSREVSAFDDKLAKLLDDMWETLRYEDGVGLAAPQIGLLRRVAVVEFEDTKLELINPVVTQAQGEQIGPEACLSVKNRSCDVARPERIVIEAVDRFGTPVTHCIDGYAARVCCHEMDHLDGILFYDKQYKGNKA